MCFSSNNIIVRSVVKGYKSPLSLFPRLSVYLYCVSAYCRHSVHVAMFYHRLQQHLLVHSVGKGYKSPPSLFPQLFVYLYCVSAYFRHILYVVSQDHATGCIGLSNADALVDSSRMQQTTLCIPTVFYRHQLEPTRMLLHAYTCIYTYRCVSSVAICKSAVGTTKLL